MIIPNNILQVYKKENVYESAEIRRAFAYGKGRMFDRWIDYALANNTTRAASNGGATDPTYTEGDLIEQPAYLFESLYRDEFFVERDLSISTYIGTTSGGGLYNYTFTVNDLSSSIDDFYNNAIIHNATTGKKYYVTGFTGSSKTIVATTTIQDTAIAAGDKIFFTNIKGDSKLDIESIDIVGNDTDGLRNGWKFNRSIYQEEDPELLLGNLLFEMRCMRDRRYDKIALIALDEEAGSVDTWTSPIKQRGKYAVSCNLSPVNNLINDLTVNYAYDYGKQDFSKKLFVNKNGYSSELTNGATYKTTCKSVYDNYHKLINKYEYNCKWISDDATAELFFNHLFEWKSKQRLIVNWMGGLKDYIKYDRGDQVILNHSRIPTGLRNVSKFMIQSNLGVPIPGGSVINFKLIQMG